MRIQDNRSININNYNKSYAKDYELFSTGKTPVEVAIALNLKESEATKFYKEYWKLKQLQPEYGS